MAEGGEGLNTFAGAETPLNWGAANDASRESVRWDTLETVPSNAIKGIFAIGFPITLGIGLVGMLLTLPMMQAPFTMALERMLSLFQ